MVIGRTFILLIFNCQFSANCLVSDHNDEDGTKSNKTKHTRIIVISVVTAGMLLIGIVLVLLVRKKKQQKGRKVTGILGGRRDDTCKKEDPELQLFDFGTIACVTNNFSLTNKLGEGGFGPVYKVMI
ncbi:hypothetical protein POTOM_039955 [Populus tomentosa]|uniref:Uncharacterized protein n=1 Tax=Populus tomentosa TaxID=118781 RepID=A0A8X7YUR1_POPTO|nr:hypothetical protein POTOM_039955 [Populus tomentosa]